MKLCTCKTSLSKLKHYWVLHRFSNLKNITLIGEAILQYNLSIEYEQFNRDTLLRLLNEGIVFDVDLKPANKDRLQLTFMMEISSVMREEPQQIDFGFENRNSRWNLIEFNVFEWVHHHNEARFGKINDALRK